MSETKDIKKELKTHYSYKWSKEALKEGMTLKEIKKIEEYLDYFYSKTYDGYVIRYYNGFVAAGILETPDDHKTKGVNPILIFACGHNTECNEIEEQINVYQTLDETENLAKALNICIKKFKKIKKLKRFKNE